MSKRVLLVKLALHIYEQSLCACGHSSLLAHGPEGHDEYKVLTVTCHACKEREKAKPTDDPGVKTFTVDLHDEPRDDDVDDDEEDGDDDG